MVNRPKLDLNCFKLTTTLTIKNLNIYFTLRCVGFIVVFLLGAVFRTISILPSYIRVERTGDGPMNHDVANISFPILPLKYVLTVNSPKIITLLPILIFALHTYASPMFLFHSKTMIFFIIIFTNNPLINIHVWCRI